MKQAILKEPGTIELQELPLPEPSPGEVLVKIQSALTCGTDLKAFIRGHSLIPMPGPFGHEYAGTVARVGKGVQHFREGDPVMGVHSAPCLKCPYCLRGLENLCEMIMEKKALGAYAGHLLLPENVVSHNLFYRPDRIDPDEAALLEPLSCVIHPCRKVPFDEVATALVIGAGAIGLLHAAYLNVSGVRVLVTDRSDERLGRAMEMGAEKVCRSSQTGEVARRWAGADGVDLVVECTGHPAVWEESVSHVRRGGMVVLFGGCPPGTNVTYDTGRLHYDELTLMGSFHYTREDVKMAYQALTEKRMYLAPLISGRFPLSEITHVFTLLKEGRGIKYALYP